MKTSFRIEPFYLFLNLKRKIRVWIKFIILFFMKLVLKNIDCFYDERFHTICKEDPCLDASWHYHPQYELIYTSKSNGIRFVGDSVSQFFPGDLVLVGANLPHLWRNDPSYYKEGSEKKVKTVVLKFMKDFMGEGTFKHPEFASINQMLEQSKFGVCFGKKVGEKFHDELIGIVDLPQGEQMIKFLHLLYQLSLTEDRQVLSSADMRQYSSEPSHRLDKVIKFISDNYADNINLQDVSDIACMTTTSFCRFFKRMTNKSFTQFLNEIRVRNASRMLLEDNITVSEICYKVGYNSITNFYMQFKQIMGSTPKDYRKTL